MRIKVQWAASNDERFPEDVVLPETGPFEILKRDGEYDGELVRVERVSARIVEAELHLAPKAFSRGSHRPVNVRDLPGLWP